MNYVAKEPIRPGEHVISEANGSRSREEVIIAAAADLPPGTVLGRVTATKKYKRLAPGASDGTQTAAAVLYGDALAATADVAATAHLRDAELNGQILSWPNGITDNQKAAAITQLTALGIIIRN